MTAVPLALIGWFGGLGFMWGLTGVAFWIVVIGLIVLLARNARTSPRAPGEPALRLLEERYARGEITGEDFLERRAVLGDGSLGGASSS